MFAFKVSKQNAEAAKDYLRKTDLLAPHMHASREGDFVFFPVVKKAKVSASIPGNFVQKKFESVVHTPSFREALVATLGQKLGHEAIAGYDTVGTTAIIEIAKGMETYQTKIARALLDSNRNIKTVLKKESAMQGEFRVRQFKWLAGIRTYAVEYHESGCLLRFDLRKTYFSTRLATERNRIAAQVKPGERVLALFAGVGPFALVIAKKQPAAQVVAVELNPAATQMMVENVRLNKTANVLPIQGDVRAVLKKYPKWADRACMPLPHTGYDFLDDVIAAMKDGGVVHFYGFGDERQGVFDSSIALVEAAASRQGVQCKILEKRVVRPYAPCVFQVVIDFQVVWSQGPVVKKRAAKKQTK
ncbi:class I SAM-dependent methyltransferase family protein [Candidatus Micrarchaeota archaeon]|nr:class I SAM-dependent methyltransferase family protein [Candidatus Micrarchaeota archaeon]